MTWKSASDIETKSFSEGITRWEEEMRLSSSLFDEIISKDNCATLSWWIHFLSNEDCLKESACLIDEISRVL